MKQSFYVYNNGDLKRKDNTLQFTNHDGEKRDIPVVGNVFQYSFYQLYFTIWDSDAFFQLL